MSIVAQKWVKAQKVEGEPKLEDFRLEEETLPELKDGEFLCEALEMSVDPYMRIFVNNLPDGTTMMGEQVAKVTSSKHPDYPVGCEVCILAGWRTHTICDGKTPEVRHRPEVPDNCRPYALGVLGMPGTTAYFGLIEVGAVKEGDVVFVNGAAGTVGSVVGQLAKAKGCTVIGTAGSELKTQWLKDLGFDHVINYKTCGDIVAVLKEAAPEGIDLFYDNVGSEMSERVMSVMKSCGRVVICGNSASYNDKNGPGTDYKGVLPYHHILMKTLKVQGFTMWQYMDRRAEAEKYLLQLIKEEKLQTKQNVRFGFDDMPAAFIDLLQGKEMGKTIVSIGQKKA